MTLELGNGNLHNVFQSEVHLPVPANVSLLLTEEIFYQHFDICVKNLIIKTQMKTVLSLV